MPAIIPGVPVADLGSTPNGGNRWVKEAAKWALRSMAMAALSFSGCSPSPETGLPLKKMFEVPAFTLVERTGQPFDAKVLKGKVWVGNFFFASCPGPCNLLNEEMRAIHQATAGTPEVQLLSISTDEADTPQVLTEYANARQADGRWFFVTGKKDDIFNLSIKGFKLALADADGVNIKDKFIHSTKIVLVDRQGWIRGYYNGFGETAAADRTRLIADIQRLLAEK